MFCKPSYVIHTQSPNFHHVQAIKCRLWLLQITIVDYDPAINPQVLPHLTGCGTHGPCWTFWKRSFHFLSVSVSWWHYNPLRRLGLDPWNLGIWESLAGGDWFDPNSTPAPPRISLEPGSWLLKRAAGREVFFHRVPTVHIDCWAGTAAAVEFPEDGAVPRQRLFCWWVMWFFPWRSWHCHLNLEGWKSLVKSRNKVLVRNWIYSLIWQWWWIRRKPLVLPSTNHFRNFLGSHRQPLLSNLTVEGRCYAALGRAVPCCLFWLIPLGCRATMNFDTYWASPAVFLVDFPAQAWHGSSWEAGASSGDEGIWPPRKAGQSGQGLSVGVQFLKKMAMEGEMAIMGL